ncbi:MAG: beta-ketoacyl-[acyl-carrier-protein] synthase family protein [Microcystis sp. M015S2]|uniref:beta-ketoacyl-[acyl-carrier-protein] synthase family protein n=1 Tax=unclassified Microcystis TaxID=2643300 RepID=UPI00258E194F|nr:MULTISPECIES: beta-ketoacyl-[acyl-carrier-protein] synthase family protein [unclassified Microcystis]MCA2711292.1 beta-ketoacyl-[acyl-carrier-protein] synthase family protein [Microcystis sp. M025S2]MCA2743589.1 beta-ketoacyl-[acyl-carrier-protein] synthase family protein [Microcystis sp. M015S2]MCA2757710.1 beta-ketoacyl-[acyl-carrier-protein] synthase family protein [Microcystis sp. M145S2]
MNKRRVVITGMGTINPNGKTVAEFWSNCCKGRSGVRSITAFPISEEYSRIAGIVDDFEPWQTLPALSPTLDRSTQFALVAAREALNQANLEELPRPERAGVFISTAIAQIASMERAFRQQSQEGQYRLEGVPLLDTSLIDAFDFNSTAKILARQYNCRGGYTTITTGCTGGLDAIGYAIAAIRSGAVDMALTGSTEAPITPLTVAAFGKIGATSKSNRPPSEVSRPFERERDGFVLAEGCGILVIEELNHALGRGAMILGELMGFGSVNNCYHMTDIPKDGKRIADSVFLALKDATLTPDAIDSINAHGSSTPQNDVAETNAYYRVFGDRAATIPVTSNKSQIGHPLSASNSIEVIASVQSLRLGIIPPTINLVEKDPDCPLNVVDNEARYQPTRCLLKTSSGFSGIHSSVIIHAFTEQI